MGKSDTKGESILEPDDREAELLGVYLLGGLMSSRAAFRGRGRVRATARSSGHRHGGRGRGARGRSSETDGILSEAMELLARGPMSKPAFNMETLKSAILHARSGEGEVKKVIESATFRPGEKAFTALINMCARLRYWRKAAEVFEAMKGLDGVQPNTYTYSALISACSSSGEWVKALEVFAEMKLAAASDPDCKPNEVTYSALITACERGGRSDKALEMYKEMLDVGLQADKVTYTSVLAACINSKEWNKAKEVLGEMHDQSLAASLTLYCDLMSHYAEIGDWNEALDLFLTVQMMEQEVDVHLCRALMRALESGAQTVMSLELLDAMRENGIAIDIGTYNSALKNLAKEGLWEPAIEVLNEITRLELEPDEDTGGAVVAACIKGDNKAKAVEIAKDFLGRGLKLELNEEIAAAVAAAQQDGKEEENA